MDSAPPAGVRTVSGNRIYQVLPVYSPNTKAEAFAHVHAHPQPEPVPSPAELDPDAVLA